MKLNYGISNDENSPAVSAQARWLMSAHRQRVQNRSQSMLQRAAAQVGIDA